jgi:exopolysaccharide biosynthesis polyprenyl glycosylphosphotransferase
MSAPESITPRLYAKTLTSSRVDASIGASGLFPRTWQACEIALDLLFCGMGMGLIFWTRHGLRWSHTFSVHAREDAAACLATAGLAVFLLHRDGAYPNGGSPLRIRETERALRAAVNTLFILLPLAYLSGWISGDHTLLLGAVSLPGLLAAARHVGAACARWIFRKERESHNAVLYGAGAAAPRVLAALFCRMQPVLVVDEGRCAWGEPISPMGYGRKHHIPGSRGPITARLLESLQCRTLIVALHDLSPAKVDAAVEAAEQAGAGVVFLRGVEMHGEPRIAASATDSAIAAELDGLSLAPQFGAAARRSYAAAKRTLDLLGSSLLLILLSPLFVLLALLVKLDSPGPVIFTQERVGRGGRHFRIFKFRSMDARVESYDFSPSTADDPRITRVGRLLRRMSLDELPQLLNVLLGHMSLVGPRPEMPFIVDGYTEEQRRRLDVLPGITGLWQLSAARAFPIHENLHYDLYYIRHRTFFMDVAILFHTLFFALRGGV